jgi:hypothetical protein
MRPSERQRASGQQLRRRQVVWPGNAVIGHAPIVTSRGVLVNVDWINVDS